MADEEAPDRLAVVRWNIGRIRREADLSQAEVAEAVSARGIKWFPQTVQKVENGSRTLRFDEAVALAEALNVEIWELLDPPGEAVLDEIGLRFHRAHERMREAATAYLRAQEEAAVVIDKLGDMGNEGAETILTSSPVHAIIDILRSSYAVSADRLLTNRLRFPHVSGLSDDSIMRRREPEYYGPSPEGSNLQLQALIERRRKLWGEDASDDPGEW